MQKMNRLTLRSMSLFLLLSLLAVALGCSGKSANTNDSALTASNKFIGTWKVATDSEADFKGGPITFKEDKTYSAQKNNEPSSSIVTGPYTVKDGKLYLDGELKKFGEAGMSLETDGRVKLTKGDKTIYFVKS